MPGTAFEPRARSPTSCKQSSQRSDRHTTTSAGLDIAGIYKADISIPIAFGEYADISAETRRAVRDHLRRSDFLDQCVQDIKALLDDNDSDEDTLDLDDESDVVQLWNYDGTPMPDGTS